jgi:hypothetical protein
MTWLDDSHYPSTLYPDCKIPLDERSDQLLERLIELIRKELWTLPNFQFWDFVKTAEKHHEKTCLFLSVHRCHSDGTEMQTVFDEVGYIDQVPHRFINIDRNVFPEPATESELVEHVKKELSKK